jgi:hypothetical protein
VPQFLVRGCMSGAGAGFLRPKVIKRYIYFDFDLHLQFHGYLPGIQALVDSNGEGDEGYSEAQ